MLRSFERLLRFVLLGAWCAVGGAVDVRAGQAAPAATYNVTNLNDSGPGSLRQAILDANGAPGVGQISITANGQLNLASVLPTITEAVSITVPGHDLFRVFRIDGQNLFRGLTVASVPVTITGVTVQHAVAFGSLPGGGIVSDGSLTLDSVTVLTSTAGGLGGGVSSTGPIFVTGGRYEGNTAAAGGGAIAAGGPLVVNGGTIRNNACSLSTCYGGGLYAAITLTMTNTHVFSNTAQRAGGGVAAFGPTQITGARFEHNRSLGGSGLSFGGGGLYGSAQAAVTLTGVDFAHNYAGLIGGGLFAEDVVMTGTRFISNTAGIVVGAAKVGNIVAAGSSFEQNDPGGLVAFGTMELTDTQFLGNTGFSAARAALGTKATRVLFANNNSPDSAGGLHSEEMTTLVDSQFVNNSGQDSGGLFASGTLAITSSVFIGNSAAGFFGGGVSHFADFTQASAHGSIVNTLFAGNTAAVGGAALDLRGPGTDDLKHVTIASTVPVTTAIVTAKDILHLQNVIVAHHALGLRIDQGFVALNNSLFHANGLDTQGSVAIDTGRATGDPLFVNPGANDYHLQAGSAAIDAGLDAGITVDIDGEARPAGGGYDIGYDEVVLARLLLPLLMR